MPTNRSREPEAHKRAQLIAAARQLFVSAGYDATAMTRIAQAAGVTPNTIYWYFKDKDELLIAVLDELLEEHIQQFVPVLMRPMAEQLLWIVERLKAVHRLVAVVHSRCAESPSIDAWHAKFHSTVEKLFGAQISQSVPKDKLAAELVIATFTIEGLVTHNLVPDIARMTCEALADRWKFAKR